MASIGFGRQVQGFTISAAKQAILNYIAPSVRNVPQAYRIAIRAYNDSGWRASVQTKMQEPLEMEVRGIWHPVFQVARNNTLDIVDMAMQSLNNDSLEHAISSRQIWRGTTPVTIRFNMVFNAETDAGKEVVAPIMILQQLALPDQGLGGDFFLKAPGPGPIGAVGTIINVNWGNFLTFNKVIVKNVTVKYMNRFTATGASGKNFPIRATARIEFDTYEILTKDRLQNEVYNLSASKITNQVSLPSDKSRIAAATNFGPSSESLAG